MYLPPGTIIEDKFEVLDCLGGGAYGIVYKARHLMMDRILALKMLDASALQMQDIKRFKQEAEILCSLQQSRLPLFYSYGIWQGKPYIAMELLVGKSLHDRLNAEKTLDLSEAIAITKQICDGLECAHNAGIVHRDLKPGNIMLTDTKDSLGCNVKIIDFGLAKLIDFSLNNNQQLTQAGMAVGTVEYMSPEQCSAKPTDARSDIYSVGCILYRMLVGEPPFTGDHVPLILKAHVIDAPQPLPPEFAAVQPIMDRCLEKDPAARYANVKELMLDLDALPKDPIKFSGNRMAVRSQDGKKTGATIGATVFGALLLVGAIAGSVLSQKPAPHTSALEEYHRAQGLGAMHGDDVQKQEALQHYSAALALNEKTHELGGEDIAQCYTKLAEKEFKSGKMEPAYKLSTAGVNKSIELQGQGAGKSFPLYLALSALEVKKQKDALKLLEELRDHTAGISVPMQVGLAYLYNDAHRFDKAMQALAPIDTVPGSSKRGWMDHVLKQKAVALRGVGRNEEAAVVDDQVIQLAELKRRSSPQETKLMQELQADIKNGPK